MHTSSLSKQQLKKIIDFAKIRCKRNDFNHNLNHIKLTVKLAKYLATKEDANINTCTVAAYLHDIAKSSHRNRHGSGGAKIAREFLRKIDVPDSLVREVCYCISQHNNGSPKKTKEAKILWDADKLQLIGPLGFARIFGHTLLIFKEEDIYKAISRAKKYERFFYKRFYTPTGRRIASSLHNFMQQFHNLCDIVADIKLDRL